MRSALESQGFPAGTLRDDGTLNPAGLLAGVYSEVEFRSSLTPTIRMNMRSLVEPATGPEGPGPFTQFLKPTVVLRGNGQETFIAPTGVSAGGGWAPAVLSVAALIGIGVVIGRSL